VKKLTAKQKAASRKHLSSRSRKLRERKEKLMRGVITRDPTLGRHDIEVLREVGVHIIGIPEKLQPAPNNDSLYTFDDI
jgi:hypothetical protein